MPDTPTDQYVVTVNGVRKTAALSQAEAQAEQSRLAKLVEAEGQKPDTVKVTPFLLG